ncbi:MAG: WD40 repeat domain-containing protein [Spirulinaceae cyanobacterium]
MINDVMNVYTRIVWLFIAMTLPVVNVANSVEAQELPSPQQEFEYEQVFPTEPWSEVRLLRTLEGHNTAVDALTFAPDDKVLLSGGSYNDAHLRLWWVRTGTQIESIRAQRTAVTALAFSPDGQTLATIGDDSGVNLWDWPSKEYTRHFLNHTQNLLSMAITPDSQVLVTGGLPGIRLWNLRTQRPIYTLVRFDHFAYALQVNPADGYTLASGNEKGDITFWNLRTGGRNSINQAHRNRISDLTFTQDGQTLITASDDRTIKVWDVDNSSKRLRLRFTLTGHTSKVRDIVLHPEGKVLASGSQDGVRIWNIETGQLLKHFYAHEDWVQSLAFNRDGTILATGGFDNLIKLWENAVPSEEPTVVVER